MWGWTLERHCRQQGCSTHAKAAELQNTPGAARHPPKCQHLPPPAVVPKLEPKICLTP